MGKKECLCEDGKATHDALYEKFLKEATIDGETDQVEKAIKLLKLEPLTNHIDARDLENLLHYVQYTEKDIPIDEGTILLLVCYCMRAKWQVNTKHVEEAKTSGDYLEGDDSLYEEYIEGQPCDKHLVCVVNTERNTIIDNFIEMVTDDSC